MPPPRRRSSRLRGSNIATPGKALNHTPNRLESLVESDEHAEASTVSQATLTATLSSPHGPRTPATSRAKAPREEMHPSKVHQSTAQEPDSGLRLGFTDVAASGNKTSGVTQQTPTKLGISSPTFNFRFARPVPQLGPEAQRMMDELREDALRIKAQLAAQREEEKRKEEAGIEGRKIAQPKGKASRFSNAHIAEFKKMDSIENHPSSFRAQPDRATAGPSLKRTQSKAQLDDREEDNRKSKQGSQKNPQPERLENTVPAKRARKRMTDDTSSMRPMSRDDHKSMPAIPTTPNTVRTQANVFQSLTTPTQASLSRAATTTKSATQIPTLSRSLSKPNLDAPPQTPTLQKSPSRPNLTGTAQIHTSATSPSKPNLGATIPGTGLSRSPSKPNLTGTPRTLPKSATTNNFGSTPRPDPKVPIQSPSKLDRVKSMLGYGSVSTRKTIAKQSSIPALKRSPSKPNLENAPPSVPATPIGAGSEKNTGYVSFTPNTVNKNMVSVQNSPSPVKSGIPRSKSMSKIGPRPASGHSGSSDSRTKEVQYPTLVSQANSDDHMDVEYPSLAAVRSVPRDREYPSLAGVRPLPQPPRQPPAKTAKPTAPLPSAPGTFTFRSDHTINFGASPKGFGSSPGQASIRQVRESDFPSIKTGRFPGNKENAIPSVPHGMPNKKRRRVGSDDETEDEFERSPKKSRTNADRSTLGGPKLQTFNPKTPNSKMSSPAKKKGGMSLSRLNMLARPKVRK